jgi:hypothetical protein
MLAELWVVLQRRNATFRARGAFRILDLCSEAEQFVDELELALDIKAKSSRFRASNSALWIAPSSLIAV